MSTAQELVSVAAAAQELGLTPSAIRHAIKRGLIEPVRLDARTNLIPRAQVDKYRAEHRGRMGRPAKTDKQPATKPAQSQE
jgi:predicted ArsR family transcriptional regulator